MAAGFVNGYAGQDLHIIRNGVDFDLTAYFDYAGALIEFKYFFPGAFLGYLGAAALSSLSSKTISGTYGKIVFNSSGVIKASPYATPPAEPKLSNVYCVVAIKQASTPGGPLTSIFDALISIHFHDSIQAIWMTPSPLTLQVGFGEFRAAVMAQYNDGIVADCTYYRGIVWSVASSYTSVFARDTATNDLFKVVSTPASLPYTANGALVATLPPELKNAASPVSTVVGTVNIANNSNSTVTHKSGDRDDLQNRKNILIVSDGFAQGEEANFNACVDDIRAFMVGSDVTIPYKYLVDKLNIWSLFVPSAAANGHLPGIYVKINPIATNPSYIKLNNIINICDAVYRRLDLLAPGEVAGYRNTFKKDYPILEQILPWPTTSPVIDPGANCDLARLINIVGLPGTGEVGKTFAQRLADWNTMLNAGSTFSLFDSSSTGIYVDKFIKDVWLLLRNREYFDIPDTAFLSMRYFEDEQYFSYAPSRPSQSASWKFAPVKINSKKEFNKFIHGINYTFNSNTVNLGNAFYDANGQKGKDGDYVMLLTKLHNLNLYGELVKTNPLNEPGVEDLGNIEFVNVYGPPSNESLSMANPDHPSRVIPANLPLPIPVEYITKHVAIHEFSHNFLLDEYSGGGGDVSGVPIPPGYLDEIKRSNLQLRSDVLGVDGPGGPDPNALNGEKIKWTWPRIQKVAVSSGALESAAPYYRIAIGAFNPKNEVPYSPIKVGDTILLRAPDLFSSKPYLKFAITLWQNNYFYMQYVGSGAFTASDYGIGSLIILPHWDATTTEYLKMVHKRIIERTTGRVGLLDDDAPYRSMKLQQPIPATITNSTYTDPLDKISNPSQLEKVVGLWAGGLNQFTKGIYHPAGYCIMRGASVLEHPEITDPEAISHANYFCPVCRYIITDAINPLVHPQIDALYNAIYPTFNP